MGRISGETLDAVNQRTDIVAVIGGLALAYLAASGI